MTGKSSPKASPKASASPPSERAPSDPPAGSTTAPEIEAEPEFDDADSSYDSQSLASSTESLSESVLEYRRLHGRTYQSTNTTEYWAPNDDQQNEGLDMIHHALLMLNDDKLFYAPIGDSPKRVLDVATGTGVWAIDFADQFPGAEVVGTDISPIQPSWVPPNLKFVLDDCLLEWTWPLDHFDFIHMRSLYGIIPDLRELHQKAFRHVIPGGWIQHLEMDVIIESDHVDIPPNHIFNSWGNMVYEAGEKLGKPFDLCHGSKMKDSLEAAGFVDVSEHRFKVPMHAWPKDPQLREAGALIQAAFDTSLEGFGVFLFTQVLGMSREQVLVFTAAMRQESRKRSNCPWFKGTVVWGRKP